MIELHTEDRRLADVFAKDEQTVESLLNITSMVVHALGNVAAVEETYRARSAAVELRSALAALDARLAADVADARERDAAYLRSFTRQDAAATLAGALAKRDDDEAHTLVNLFGAELPAELEPYVERTGGHGPLIPKGVLAKWATGQPLPEPDDGEEG